MQQPVLFRSDPQVIMAIEKSIIKGLPLLLENCNEHMDSLVMPIIQHRNTAVENMHDEGQYLVLHVRQNHVSSDIFVALLFFYN